MSSGSSVTLLVSNGWSDIAFKINSGDTLKKLMDIYASRVAEERNKLIFLCDNVLVTESTVVSTLTSENIKVELKKS